LPSCPIAGSAFDAELVGDTTVRGRIPRRGSGKPRSSNAMRNEMVPKLLIGTGSAVSAELPCWPSSLLKDQVSGAHACIVFLPPDKRRVVAVLTLPGLHMWPLFFISERSFGGEPAMHQCLECDGVPRQRPSKRRRMRGAPPGCQNVNNFRDSFYNAKAVTSGN
jgi:hypothetical protein